MYATETNNNNVVKRAKNKKKWTQQDLSPFYENAFDSIGPRPKDVKLDHTQKDTIVQKPDKINHADFDISDMMLKLEASIESIDSCLIDSTTFLASEKKIQTSSDIILMMSKTLLNSNPEYEDPDSFLKYSENMKDSIQQIKIFTKQKEYKKTSEALTKLKKSCNDCHSDYRL